MSSRSSSQEAPSYPYSNYVDINSLYYHSLRPEECYEYGIPPMSIATNWRQSHHHYPSSDSEYSAKECTNVQPAAGAAPAPANYFSFHCSSQRENQMFSCSSPPPLSVGPLTDKFWEAGVHRYIPSISIALDEPLAHEKKPMLVDSNDARTISLDGLVVDSGAIGVGKQPRSSKPRCAAPVSMQEPPTKVSDGETQVQTHMYSQFRIKLESPRPPRNTSRRGVCSSEPPLHDKLRMRIQHLACYFCRRRKIGCVFQDETDPNRTCNQCERRGLRCSFPSESYRGLRYRTRDGRRVTKARAD